MNPLRPRVAYFSPLSPDPSGIADYSEELLPLLRERWEIDLFVDGYEPTHPATRGLAVIDCAERDPVPLLADYDAVLYHVGNSNSHAYIYDTLMAWPGLVVLHEVSLQHFMAARTVGAKRSDLYLQEMRINHGDAGAERARRSLYGGAPMPWIVDPLAFPLHRRVLGQATGVLVLSEFAERAVRETFPDLHVTRTRHHALPISEDRLEAAGSESRSGESRCRFIIAGNLTPNKGVEASVRALARLHARSPIELRLVGRVRLDCELDLLLREFGLEECSVIRGRVDQDELYGELLRADVCICLRDPTLGEASGIALRAMASGLPLVVSAEGWFRELPDEAVVKVPKQERLDLALEAVFDDLAADPIRRQSMSSAALRYAAECTLERSVEDYDRFVHTSGFFRGRHAGRAFLRMTELFRSLDFEYAGAAAKFRAGVINELTDWRAKPRSQWRSDARERNEAADRRGPR